MGPLSRQISRGELTLAVLGLTILLGSSYGALLSHNGFGGKSSVAAVATGVEATQQATLKSSAPQSCTEAIKDALGMERGPGATTVDSGQSGTLDACFGGVVKKGKKPSQNPADYDCFGRSGKVTLAGGKVTSTTYPDSGVTKGKCKVQICDNSSGSMKCGDPKLADGTSSIPQGGSGGTSGQGATDPLKDVEQQPVPTGTGLTKEEINNAFENGTKPVDLYEGYDQPQWRADAVSQIDEYGNISDVNTETGGIGPVDSNWYQNSNLSDFVDQYNSPYSVGESFNSDTIQNLAGDSPYSLGDRFNDGFMEQLAYEYSPYNIGEDFGIGDFGSDPNGYYGEWSGDLKGGEWVNGELTFNDAALDPGVSGFDADWTNIQADTFDGEPTFDDFEQYNDIEDGFFTPEVINPVGVDLFGNAPDTTPTFNPTFEDTINNSPALSDSWWKDPTFTDTPSPLESVDLPQTKWEPPVSQTPTEQIEREVANYVTPAGMTPPLFRDKVGQSGLFSYDIDITAPPAHFAEVFNENLSTDIATQVTAAETALPIIDPWAQDVTSVPIDMASLSAGFGTTQTKVAGLPPIFTTWGQTTFTL